MGKIVSRHQTKFQKKRVIEAKKKGHKHIGFDKLVKSIERKNNLSDESARRIAGKIQQNMIKKYGSKTVISHGKKHVEPAI